MSTNSIFISDQLYIPKNIQIISNTAFDDNIIVHIHWSCINKLPVKYHKNMIVYGHSSEITYTKQKHNKQKYNKQSAGGLYFENKKKYLCLIDINNRDNNNYIF